MYLCLTDNQVWQKEIRILQAMKKKKKNSQEHFNSCNILLTYTTVILKLFMIAKSLNYKTASFSSSKA